MKRQFMTLMLALLACVTTFAAGRTSLAAEADYTALQLNTPFVVANMDLDKVWTFTADNTGIVKIEGATENDYFGPCLDVFDDEAFTNHVGNFIFYPAHYEFSAAAGHTYYIKNNNWCGQDINARLTMDAGKFGFTKSEPADKGTFYITSDNNATLTFSSTVAFAPKTVGDEEAADDIDWTVGALTIGDNVINIYNFTDYNNLIKKGIFTYTEEGTSGIGNWNGNICAREEGVNIVVPFTSSTGHGYFNVVNRLFDEGKIKAGDEMKLTLHGVQNALTGELLNDDGKLEVTWYFAGAPTTLVASSVPDIIKSWYNPGDAEGVATFTFSRGIKSARASLEMGMGEGADDLYTEEIAPDHVIIDGATVKVDLTGVMRTNKTMGLKMNWPTFTLQLYSVVDVDGNGTYSEDLGSASSYTFTAQYADISKTLSYEITPATGSVLTADNKQVEIWFNELGLIEFDGVTITYYTTETVKETVTENVYNEETGVWEEVTREVETEQNVAHETFIKYADLNVVADPDGTTITFALPEGIHEAKNVCVKLNVTSSTDGLPHVVAAYYNTQVMYGLPVDLCAEPASESTVSRLKEIYLPLGFVYSINNKVLNPVTVSSKTNPMYSGKGTIVADGMVQAKIVLDDAITEEGSYTVSVAEGVIGDYIYGESGFNSGTTHEAFNLYYAVDGRYAGKSVVCEPNDGETVQSLSQFTVTFFDYANVAPSWDPEKYAYVIDAEGQQYLGTFAESDGSTNTVVFTLNEPITAEGTYTFVLTGGSVANAANGDPITTTYEFTYTVDGTYVPPVAVKPLLNPAEGVCDEIGNILIDFGQPVTLVKESAANDWWVPQPTLISTDNGATVFATGNLSATDDPNVVIWMQEGTSVKACDVEFNIPAGCVQFADGTTNPEYTYTYTITGANAVELTVVATTPELLSTVNELGEMTVTFDKAVTVGEWPSVVARDAFWAKEVRGTIVATDDPATVKIVFPEPIKEFGETSIAIEAYSLLVNGKAYDQDIYLSLTIGENGGGDIHGGDDPIAGENVTITPDATVAQPGLRYFEITFGGYVGAWNEKPITLADQYDNVVAKVGAYGMSAESASGAWFWELGKPNTYSITLPQEITEDGFYVLTVPAVCEKADGNTVNRTFYFTFQIDSATGIASIAPLDKQSTIYTLGGVKVSTISRPGIYIINGKKVIIR